MIFVVVDRIMSELTGRWQVQEFYCDVVVWRVVWCVGWCGVEDGVVD